MNEISDIAKIEQITRPKSRTGLMVIGVFLLTALVIIVSVLLHEQSLSAYEQELSEQRMTNLPQDIKDLRAREERLLTTAEVLDSANSICRIPIERAMELMVRDYEEAGE